jgi:hypothetical protein
VTRKDIVASVIKMVADEIGEFSRETILYIAHLMLEMSPENGMKMDRCVISQ